MAANVFDALSLGDRAMNSTGLIDYIDLDLSGQIEEDEYNLLVGHLCGGSNLPPTWTSIVLVFAYLLGKLRIERCTWLLAKFVFKAIRQWVTTNAAHTVGSSMHRLVGPPLSASVPSVDASSTPALPSTSIPPGILSLDV